MKHRSVIHGVSMSLLVIVTVLAAGCGGEGSDTVEPAVETGAHSIIIIAVDGLRADSLAAYGGNIATPSFDTLAFQSARFEWAFAQAPEPAASFTALMTGLYPTTSGVLTAGDRLPDEAETLAESFESAGFETAVFLEGEPGGDDLGLAQGFDEFTMSSTAGADAVQWLTEHADESFLLVVRGWSVGLDLTPENVGVDAPEGFFERLQQVLVSRSSDAPLAFEASDLEYIRAAHTRRVEATDTALGELMAVLDEVGLSDHAILVVSGTTGLDLDQHGPTGSLSLHSTVTRVPLFMRIPGGLGAGQVAKIVELVDVMPTLLDVTGADVPSSVQGASLVPIMEGSGRPPYIAFSESPNLGGQRAVAMGGMRLLTSVDGEEARLYDLAVDPAELVDIAAEAPDRVEVLQRHLEAWSKMVSVASLDPELRTEEELDDETLEQLKSLGYIQ